MTPGNGPDAPPDGASGAAGCLAGGGELGARLRAFDWDAHPLGPPARWPQSLQTAVRIMLTARQPIWIGWGPSLHYLYNDAYKAIIGGKHPAALGQPTSVVWKEIWSDITPLLERAMGGDEGTYVEGQLLIMERSGYREETHYTFSYTPIPDGDRVGGIICFNTDDTGRVIGERQLTLLRDLGAEVGDLRSAAEVWQRAAAALAGNARDVPFAACYAFDGDGATASLVAATGIEPGSAAAPHTIALAGAAAPWPLARVFAERAGLVVHRSELPAADLPRGAWDEPPHQAVVMPVLTENTRCAGAVVFGLNPFRLFDDGYRGFLALVTGQIGASLGRAVAYEQERMRADALAALDRAKTTFFSNVSHELRTPLTLILGPLDDALAARHGELPAAAGAALAVARRNAHRLLRLVNTLLDFSRIESGKIQATFAPVDVAAVTADVASCFRAAIERAGMRLAVDCAPATAPVYVDRDLWEKVVLNLLSNAFKHTFAGEIRVTVRERAGCVELVVADTGTGIPAEAIPHLFDRFFRVEGAVGRSHEGSGIGLALVADVVALHGGTVHAHSEVGRGSTFTVTLPLGVAHLPADRVRGAGEPSPRPVSIEPWLEELAAWQADVGHVTEPDVAGGPRALADVAGAHVLVADDNVDMRGYLARTLAAAGLRVTTVADGEAALAAIAAEVPDLLVTDVMMPRVDGLELLRRLRAEPTTAALPVIVLSARAGEDAMLEGLGLGADDYVYKPFSARELLARVEAQVRLSRTRRAAEQTTREAEAAVRASEERLRRITDALPVLIGYVDAEERYRYNNRGYEQWFGQPAATLIGRTLRDVLGDAAYAHIRPAVARALGGETFTFRTEIPYRDGGPRQVEATYVPDRDQHGAVAGFYALVIDVTERHAFEQALRESEQRFRQMADHAPVMIWVTNADGACTYLNQSWYEFTGRTPEPAPPLDWVGALHPDDRTAAHVAFVAANARGERFRIEYRLRRADGTFRWALDAASPRFAADGTFLGYIGSVIDITERREAEQLQRELLAREREARVAAETATRLKDEFLATLSHELRTPLNAILGWSRLLRQDLADPERARHAVDIIERNGRAQAQLVADMLDMSRILAGKMRVEVRPIELGSVVSAAVDTVRTAADAKGVSLWAAASPALVVHGDAERLQQVVWNLLSNAVKFTPRGGRVDVSLARAGAVARVRVADTGEGISPAFLPRLFGRFNQADGSTSRPHGGLGIGLALVKELVELHGGTVHVASDGVGRGAVFVVDLPLAGADALPSDAGSAGSSPLPADAPAAADVAIDLRGVRALVVDDDADSLALVERALSDRGVLVTTAGSGSEALAALARGDFDVIVSDIGMSPMDGYTLLGEVRRRGFGTPALALTAFARPADRTRAQLSGYQQHLAKPVTVGEIVTAVAAAAGRLAPRADGEPA